MANGEQTPNRTKWPDVALNERFRGYDREIELIREAHEAMASLPQDLAATLNRVEDRLELAMRERDGRLNTAIAAVAKSCSDFQKEYRDDRNQWRQEHRDRAITRTQAAAALIVGALGLFGVVLAALITSHSL